MVHAYFALLAITIVPKTYSNQASATPTSTYGLSAISDLQEYASKSVGTSGGTVTEHVVLAGITLPPPPQSTATDQYGVSYSFSYSSNTVTAGSTAAGSTFYFGLGAANMLSGGNVTLTETILYSDTHTNADGSKTSISDTITTTHVYEFDKLLPNATAIDSRKTFGQPDLAGEEPGDPNAPERNVNFSGWIYNGGMFVGYEPFGGGDLSGTARIQVYLPTQSLNGTTLYSTLTLLDNGIPSTASGSMNVVAWQPLSTDPNIGSTASTVTWANAWTPQTPFKTQALTSSSPNTYINFEIGAGLYWLIGLSLDNENGYSSAVWHYFGSAAYSPPPNALLPQTDCAPRIWRVGQIS